MAPPFKFGMQKNYRLNEMDSRRGERKKAETLLKEGTVAAQSATEISGAAPSTTMGKSPSAATGAAASKK